MVPKVNKFTMSEQTQLGRQIVALARRNYELKPSAEADAFAEKIDALVYFGFTGNATRNAYVIWN
jgi:hypothetical protein